ncbi:DUF3737 family protein [Bifidobacterium leontopitheci]|uniref:Hydrogenase n=1 Tax=Bifidobacterium leontopitheci TaxID=2650774 RepID=A0A6I1GRB1_9BIFI|nr:DUF3737 family protein [Bifidobacterium leontopitheci]KAB7790678.1 hydrogenase [Bifidobacterium leontopitheci]
MGESTVETKAGQRPRTLRSDAARADAARTGVTRSGGAQTVVQPAAGGARTVRQQRLTGERAEFFAHDVTYVDTIFADGESPLKHARGVTLRGVSFQWKYPLWYCSGVDVRDSTWFEMARAGVWYTEHMVVEDSTIEAPKNFRRCRDLTLRGVDLTHAEETLWACSDVTLHDVVARGDYFGMNCENVTAERLRLVGNYPFDGAHDVIVRDSRLVSKDAFWNCENVTVEHSTISGEYLGWNSRNLTFIDCTIESLQGLCYVDNLVMKDCRLVNTTRAFEYSTVDVDAHGTIDSVVNPSGGLIRADRIGTLVMEPERVDPSRTTIITGDDSRKETRA